MFHEKDTQSRRNPGTSTLHHAIMRTVKQITRHLSCADTSPSSDAATINLSRCTPTATAFWKSAISTAVTHLRQTDNLPHLAYHDTGKTVTVTFPERETRYKDAVLFCLQNMGKGMGSLERDSKGKVWRPISPWRCEEDGASGEITIVVPNMKVKGAEAYVGVQGVKQVLPMREHLACQHVAHECPAAHAEPAPAYSACEHPALAQMTQQPTHKESLIGSPPTSPRPRKSYQLLTPLDTESGRPSMNGGMQRS